jgi:hypothetical protein
METKIQWEFPRESRQQCELLPVHLSEQAVANLLGSIADFTAIFQLFSNFPGIVALNEFVCHCVRGE